MEQSLQTSHDSEISRNHHTQSTINLAPQVCHEMDVNISISLPPDYHYYKEPVRSHNSINFGIRKSLIMMLVFLVTLSPVNAFGLPMDPFRYKGTHSLNFNLPYPSLKHGRTVLQEKSLAQMEDEVDKRMDLEGKGSGEGATFQSSDGTYFELSNDNGVENREQSIREMLEEEERAWRESKRREDLGKYADTKDEDWEKLEKEEIERINKENEKKALFAKQSGVTLNLLAEKISSEEEESDNKAGGNLNGEADGASKKGKPRIINGKMVSLNRQTGVSVGSAGGWSLEVYPGDFVVHRKYGIGRFDKTVLKSKSKLTEDEEKEQGSRRQEIVKEMMEAGRNNTDIEQTVKNFGSDMDEDSISNPQATVLEVTYSDCIVHVPVDKAYRLSRYRAGDSPGAVKLSRVKSLTWEKAKNKVKEDTIRMAQDVLALYSTREALQRTPSDPMKEVKVKEFEKTFQYQPTPDQLTCFEAVENDMVWRSRPMDRLVCGDVGFGKTEVALRALFRCVENGRQGALLAPTGVLAAQHLKNVINRMGNETDFKFRIALLRGGMGKNTKIGKQLREKIAQGDVDLVVGTHALLTGGIQFKNLGLLVVDEEQRFGVKQKDRIKLICSKVDVLTLSATPIPRTLQMSLSGIRDTSTIRSPPPMRKPIKTYVTQFDENMVKVAIEQEIARGGQCFYVVPRISQIEEASTLLHKLFPTLKIIIAHGRMTRGSAEENVASFAEGSYDVLIATTVIENGVDIPRVNTILIQNAQGFGMSTLYQLRGRVGRSDQQAYAWYFYKEGVISEQSEQRLLAMEKLQALGSGFDVANRDLEIRGAGSLLGTEQSGMASKVGFDLYMRMLKKSLRQLRGLDLPMVFRTNILLPSGEGSLEIIEGPDGMIHSFQIPQSYIPDEKERMTQEGFARLAECTSQLVDLTNDWKKSYGDVSASLQKSMLTLHLHACTRTLGIDLVGLKQNSKGEMDCVLRSPGLRPRHWAYICQSLPGGIPTNGLDVFFPARFSSTKTQVEKSDGGVDIKELLTNPSYGDDEEEWDALDQEEVEAMKQISSAKLVTDLDEINIDDTPYFIVKNFSKVKKGSRVTELLKALLPASKIVFDRHKVDQDNAKVSAELRAKRKSMTKQKKNLDAQNRKNQYLDNYR